MILRLFICLMVLGLAAQPAAAARDRVAADGAGIVEAVTPSASGLFPAVGSDTHHCNHFCPGCGHGPSCSGQSGCHAPAGILAAPFRLALPPPESERPLPPWAFPAPPASSPPGKPPRTLA